MLFAVAYMVTGDFPARIAAAPTPRGITIHANSWAGLSSAIAGVNPGESATIALTQNIPGEGHDAIAIEGGRDIVLTSAGGVLTLIQEATNQQHFAVHNAHIFSGTTYNELQSLINTLPTTGVEQTINITAPLIDSGTLPVIIIGNRNIRLVSAAPGGTTLMHTGVVAGQGVRHFQVGVSSGAAVDNRLTITDGITITRQPGLTTVGGGVSVYSGATFNMEGGAISNNRTSVAHGGGGVSVISANANISGNSRIENNSTTNNGGGLAIGGLANPLLTSHVTISGNARIIGNTATGGGGVSFGGTGSILEMTGGTIGGTAPGEANQASFGGGLRMTNDTAIATISGNARIAGNIANATTSAEGGGGIWLQGGSLTMNGGVIEHNIATSTTGVANGGGGGGVAITTVAQQVSTFTMNGGAIRNNHAASNGGGVRRGSNPNAHFTMHGGEIRDNTAALDGGGLYAQGEAYRPVLEPTDYARITMGPNAVFTGNHAGNGAFRPPDTSAVDNRIQTTSSSVFDHPVNNFDINFRLEPRVTALTITYVTNTAQGIFSPPGAEDLRTETIPLDTSTPPTPQQVPGVTPRPGFVFDGWTKDGDPTRLTDAQVRATVIRDNTTFTAQWRPEGLRPEPPPAQAHHAFLIGFRDGTIRPNANITRAEAATIFFRIISDQHRASIWSQANSYPDVSANSWFNNAVSTMTRGGLFIGLPNGAFEPNRPITRAEFTTAVARFVGISQQGSAAFFSDIDDHWAEAKINAMAYHGLVHGADGIGGAFLPDQLITRAEAAAIINRMLNRLPESPADLLPNMRTWPDNMNPQMWYYLYIQEATNSHTHELKADRVHERWVTLLPPRPWELLERPDSRPENISGG